MAEQKIEIKIDENGKITAETFGIKGELCIEELQKLLEGIADVESIKKTDEFYQQQEMNKNNQIKNKKI